jgi:hypothetical protein
VRRRRAMAELEMIDRNMVVYFSVADDDDDDDDVDVDEDVEIMTAVKWCWG